MGKKGKNKAAAAADDEDIDALLSGYNAAADVKHQASTTEVDGVATRANAAVACRQGKLWIHGGERFVGEDTVTYDDLYYHETKDGKWFQVKTVGTNKPCERNAHQAVLFDDALFLYGGEHLAKNGMDILYQGDLWRLDLQHLRWNDITGLKLPSARAGHRMAVLNDNHFAIFGGYNDPGHGKPKKFNDLTVIKQQGETKVSTLKVNISGAKPTPRSGMCFTSPQPGFACVYGGSEASGKALNDLWAIDLSAALSGSADPVVWREIALSNNPSPRMGLSAVSIPGEARTVLFGGLSESREGKKKKVVTSYNDTWEVSAAEGMAFKKLHAGAPKDDTNVPVPRMSAGIAYDETTKNVYIFGGVVEVSKGQETLGDLWRLKSTGGKWRRVAAGDAVMGIDSEDDEEEEEAEEAEEGDSDGVDDELTDDGLPYGYGVEEPMTASRRLTQFTKGTVGQFNAWHYSMMNDADRNTFYQTGLSRSISKGESVVFDIGSGAGLLTLLAAKEGAKRVIGCECRAQICEAANVNIRNNSYESVASILNAVSSDLVKNKQPAEIAQTDTIVHELFGALLLGERSLKFVSEARRALGSVKQTVPRRGIQHATLIHSAELKEITDISAAEQERLGLDLHHCSVFKDTSGLQFTKAMGINMGGIAYTALSKPVPVADVDYMKDTNSSVELEVTHPLEIIAEGEVTAVLYTWEAWLDAEDRSLGFISTEPGVGGAQRAAAWGQAYQLVEKVQASAGLPQPVTVSPGKPASLNVRFSKDLAALQCDILDEA